MKITLYIIWILVSVAIASKSIDSDKYGWVETPAMASCMISITMWLMELLNSF